MLTYHRLLVCFLVLTFGGDNLPGFTKQAVAEELAVSSDSESTTAETLVERYPLAKIGPKPDPIESPSPEDIHEAIERGVEFLLTTQVPHGAWGRSGSAKYYRIWAPVPGAHQAFRTATTSLSLMALAEARDRFDGEFRERIESAIDLGQDWLLKNGGELRRSEPDAYSRSMGYALYNVWGHAYAIHALVRLHERASEEPEIQDALLKQLEYHVFRLEKDAFLNGGWGYYDMEAKTQVPGGSPIGFTTATVLIALKEAATLGVDFPENLKKKAVDSILRQRYPDFAYAYGEYLRYHPRTGINRPAGSLGRSQVCNLALRAYGDPLVTDEVLENWLNRMFARHGWLSNSRKRHIPGKSPHFASFGIAGYFFYYGHFYAAMCVEELPPEDQRYFQEYLAHFILPLQEKDGSWWDYMLYDYHQQYGTAMAICTLLRCQYDDVAESE